MNGHPQRNGNVSNSNMRRRYPKCSFAFIVVCLISVIVMCYDYVWEISIKDYTISIWPIVYKLQLYRIITHFFVHYGVMHMIVNLFFLYYMYRKLEREIGTVYTLIYTLQSLIGISVIYIITMMFIRYVVGLLINTVNVNFADQCGLSSLIFALFNFLCLFDSIKGDEIKIIINISIRTKTDPWSFLIFAFGLTSNLKLTIGHFSGIMCGFLIKDYFGKYTFPSLDTIIYFEKSKFFQFLASKYFILLINRSKAMKANIKEMLTNKYDKQKHMKKHKIINDYESIGEELHEYSNNN